MRQLKYGLFLLLFAPNLAPAAEAAAGGSATATLR